jgi:hypothetical protein
MTTASMTPVSGALATQLTFAWDQAEEPATIGAESLVQPSRSVEITDVPPRAALLASKPVVEDVAPSLTAALNGDRIGRPFKMGSVMFRLLKSYGITDEEIAAGVAAYNSRKVGA